MNCTKDPNVRAAPVPESIREDDFRAWLRRVDRLYLKRWGMRLDDLPDMHTRAAFDAGTEPEEFFEDEVIPLAHETFGGDADVDDDDTQNDEPV